MGPMAHLSVVGGHSVNGVAALHTELLNRIFSPNSTFSYLGKFNNKTNGITPRRWLLVCNPRLSGLITSKIGHGWERDLDKLRALEEFAEDSQFQIDFMNIKHANKVDLARIIKRDCGVEVNPNALFDVQIKRLHEYKRQHLNLLHILAFIAACYKTRISKSRRESSSLPPRRLPDTTWPSVSSRLSTRWANVSTTTSALRTE